MKTIETDTIGNDLIQVLAKKLFKLDKNCLFTQIHSAQDPRGYLDLYGSDFDKNYILTDQTAKRSIEYKTLTCFFNHISFISGNYDCSVIPEEADLNVYITNSNNNIVTEKTIITEQDFFDFVYEIVNGENHSRSVL